jgi:uncharacterized repeat protein (TIGR03943 family)
VAVFIHYPGDWPLIHKTPDLKHILSWATFLFWSGMFAIYFFSGDYTDFLNPQLGWLVGMAFLLCFFFFASLFFAPSLKTKCSNGCCHADHHSHAAPDVIRILIVLAPVLFITGFESGQLGDFAFQKRAIAVGKIDANAAAYTREFEVPGESIYQDMLVASVASRLPAQVTLLDVHADFEKLLGRRIQTKGIYIGDSKTEKTGTFVIFRFIIVCCIADAQPLAVLVKGKLPKGIGKEDWVVVEGILEKTQFEGNDAAIINADHVMIAPEPMNPYLAPRLR